MKKLLLAVVALLLFATLLPIQNSASAATGYTFDRFEYADEENTILAYVYLKNAKGYVNRFRLDNNTVMKINNTPTVADGFKYGMEVQFERKGLGKLLTLQGVSKASGGQIVENSKEAAGTVVTIDPNGMFIELKLSTGKEVEYFITKDTQFFKGTEAVDMSYMYEGDRVKVRFSSLHTNTATQVEIYNDGQLIENLYRGKIQMVNTATNRLTIKNAQPFANWTFGSSIGNLKTFKFDNQTSIYYGDKKILKSNIRKYRNSDVYFVTTKINGAELVKKIVIIQNYERTYFSEITAFDSNEKVFKLSHGEKFRFHNGSILVRNGRIIEPKSLVNKGSAYVIADGVTKSYFSHIVNVVNDSFLSPNLATHELYFGEFTNYNSTNYTIQTDNLLKLENNFFRSASDQQFAYSNNTDMKRIASGIKFDVSALSNGLKGRYAYFYVKDGHVRAIQFTDLSANADMIHTGRVTAISTPSISLENATTWTTNGNWVTTPAMLDVDLSVAMIIKNGQIINVNDIKPTDRVVLLKNTLNGNVIDIALINE